METLKRPEDVQQYAFYRAHVGPPVLGEEVVLLILSHTTFKQPKTKKIVHGIQAFDNRGRHRLIEYRSIGLETSQDGAIQGWIRFESEATDREVEEAMREVEEYHSGPALLHRAEDLGMVILPFVEAVGLIGSTSRHIDDPIANPWPSDLDMLFFVPEKTAFAHLDASAAAGRMPAVPNTRASLNTRFTSILHLPQSVLHRTEYILRGNVTAEEKQGAKNHGNPRMACRELKLDAQIVPCHMSDRFRRRFDELDKDPTFLDTVHPDMVLLNGETGTFSKTNRGRISWPLRPIP